MSSSALNNYVAAVAKFYLINDKPINISRVNRFMPEPLKVKKDRGYQPEEILKDAGTGERKNPRSNPITGIYRRKIGFDK